MQEKTILLTLSLMAAGIAIGADTNTRPEIIQIKQGTDIMILNALSDNGRWALSTTAAGEDADNLYGAGGTLVDVETQELTVIETASGIANVNDVTDSGMVVGSEGNQPAYWSPETKTWTILPINETRYDIGGLIAVTPDGSRAVGYLGNSANEMLAKPIVYDLNTNSEISLQDVPYRGMDGVDYGQTYLSDISADGRYVLGTVATSYLAGEGMKPAMWAFVYDLETQTYTPIGYNLDKDSWTWTPKANNLHMIMSQAMSANGQYVGGLAYIVNRGGSMDGGTEGYVAYLYDVVNDEIKVYDREEELDYQGDRPSNDGMLLASASALNPYPTGYVRYNNFFISIDQILSQVYGIDLETYNGDGISGHCKAISADGRTLVMISYDNCYILRLKEDLMEAASRVDLLADYTLSVPNGSVMTNFTQVDLTFQRSIIANGDYSSIKAYDSAGNVWSTALASTGVSNDNDKKLHISFRTKQMTEGETYTVVVPADYVELTEDSSIKNHEIRFSYIGRANTAVAPVRITPTPGTKVAELSSNDYIQLSFDTQVKVQDDFSAKLYVEGQETAIATLSAAYRDKNAVFYPTTTQYLYDGTNYYVVIGPNSITDLSGAGGNEEIKIDFAGAYVRTISADDKYIFYEDFSPTTATWATNFMFWQTEWNQPLPQLANDWNFTTENPWFTVRDSNSSTDQAIASVSMFSPAGTADKWLMTPQLYLPDDKSYLAFDAQSYLTEKEDVLRVYVYSTPEVYNLVTADMVDDLAADIRTKGDLVLETTLSPGEKETILEGDWQHYVIELSKYAGKEIYILFNNNNTDQSAIFLDNIMVVRNFAFMTSLTTPESVVAQKSVAVKGSLIIDDDLATFSTAKLILKNGQGEEVDRIEETDLMLKKGDKYDFEFAKELPLVIGDINKYILDITLDNENAIIEQAIKDLAFEPVRKVVLEEVSGVSCGNCPRGFVAVDYLSNLYPNNFIPVILRVYAGDTNGTGIWSSVTTYADNILTANQAPLGTVDRIGASSPMEQLSSGLSFSSEGKVDSTTGQSIYTWTDYVNQELNTPADGDIQFSVEYDSETRTLTVPCTVRYAMNTTGKNIGLFAVVTEDQVATSQLNYLYTEEEPLYGEWGKGGIYGQYYITSLELDHVARYPFTTQPIGEYMTTTDFEAAQEYEHTLSATLPEGIITNPEQSNVVVMMIDGITGRVINANTARFGTSTAGLENSTELVCATNIAMDNGKLHIVSGQDSKIQVFNLNGIELGRVETRANTLAIIDMHGYQGIALIAVQNASGTKVNKIVIR